MCAENKGSNEPARVPNFTVVGFAPRTSANRLAEAHAKIPGLRAVRLQACVSATYDAASNQICFSIPIYGDFCVQSPIQIPVGAELQVCAETCGSIIPTGVMATVYLNGNEIYSDTIVGDC
jgi:hypothetical protein